MTKQIKSYTKHRRFIIILLASITIIPGFSQVSKADKLFDNKQYYEAVLIYEKEANTTRELYNFDIQLKIGLCYLNINRPQAALPWLEQAVNKNENNANIWYSYGLALQQTGNYLKALNAFKHCIQIQPGHPSAASKIASCQFALQNNQINPYTNFRLATEVNTAGSEFGISLFTNHMIYYSAAGSPTKDAKIDPRTGLQYAELYMARLHHQRLVNPQLADYALPKNINGLFTYDSIARRVYFYDCNSDNNRCGIYTCQWKNNKWSTPEMILQSKKNQAMGHPAIANGGKRLYFTSNAPEGIGQTDIWYIDQADNGKWGPDVNAGNAINTPGREEFPFVYADSLLFFASDGHIGYGGLDIFCSVIKNNTFSPPVNLRRPYNSQGDDFNLVITGNIGMMSSSRNEIVSDDIYLFEGIPSLLYLSGNILNANTGMAVKGARLALSVDGKTKQQTTSDSTGYYGLFLNTGKSLMLYVRATGYKPSLVDVRTDTKSQFSDIQRDIKLYMSEILPVTISLYDKTTGRPIAERGVIYFYTDGDTQIGRTDATGTFKLAVQEDQKEYWVKFPDGYYLTESIVLNEEQKTYSLGVQPLNEELFSGWLRFKKDSAEPIEMSQPLIPRIASIIKANPGIIFQISGYRDSSSELRLPSLATQRAEYIVRRLIEEGVDKQQLTIIASKESKNNSPLTEEQMAAKRKVEIGAKK